MTYDLNSLFSLSVGIGAIAGWVRFKKIDSAFLPYLVWMGASFLNEIYGYCITQAGYSTIINYNIFSLAESIMICWQFKRWNLFDKQNHLYYFLQAIIIAGWVSEFIARKGAEHYLSFFIIFYSAITVLMSINMLNRIIFKEPSVLIFHPVFLICMGMIVYFTYAVLVETFWVYGLNKSTDFRIKIYEILSYINLFTNLIFAFATIWIPLKPRYILRY